MQKLDDETLDINLRPSREVAARCVILATLVRRFWLEMSPQSLGADDRAGEAFDLRAWLQTEGLSPHLTSEERAWIDRPIGTLPDDALATIALQAEGLATLGWSVGLAARTLRGQLNGLETIILVIPAPWEPVGPWIAGATLRAEEDIAIERERAEFIAWRVGVELPRRGGAGKDLAGLAQVIADAAREAAAAGLVDSTPEGDLVVKGKLITAHAIRDLEHLSILTEQRLRALNWLCGFGDAWDRVPLEV